MQSRQSHWRRSKVNVRDVAASRRLTEIASMIETASELQVRYSTIKPHPNITSISWWSWQLDCPMPNCSSWRQKELVAPRSPLKLEGGADLQFQKPSIDLMRSTCFWYCIWVSLSYVVVRIWMETMNWWRWQRFYCFCWVSETFDQPLNRHGKRSGVLLITSLNLYIVSYSYLVQITSCDWIGFFLFSYFLLGDKYHNVQFCLLFLSLPPTPEHPTMMRLWQNSASLLLRDWCPVLAGDERKGRRGWQHPLTSSALLQGIPVLNQPYSSLILVTKIVQRSLQGSCIITVKYSRHRPRRSRISSTAPPSIHFIVVFYLIDLLLVKTVCNISLVISYSLLPLWCTAL